MKHEIRRSSVIKIAVLTVVIFMMFFFIDPINISVVVRIIPFIISSFIAMLLINLLCGLFVTNRKLKQVKKHVNTGAFIFFVIWLLYSVKQLTLRDFMVVVLVVVIFVSYSTSIKLNSKK